MKTARASRSAAVAVLFAAAFNVYADTARIPLANVARVLGECLQGSQLRLNNYAGPAATPHLRPNDSTLQLSPCLGGGTHRFTIPEVTQRVPAARPGMDMGGATFYVNDIKFRRFTVTPNPGGLTAVFPLEDTGVEVRGHCFGAVCSFIPNGVLDVNATSAQLSVYFTPQVLGRDVSYGAVRSDVALNINTNARPPLDAMLGVVREPLRSAAAAELAKVVPGVLMQNQPRAAFAAYFRRYLNQNGIKDVRAVRVEGANLFIEHGPASAPAKPATPPAAPGGAVKPAPLPGVWAVFGEASPGSGQLVQVGRLIPLPDGSGFTIQLDRMVNPAGRLEIRRIK